MSGVTLASNAPQWKSYIERLRQKEWRTSIFVDLILNDARRFTHDLTFLDIGCGRGFDDDPSAQANLAAQCARYVGIEPDPDISVATAFDEVHRCNLEDAPVEPGSVDIAWAVMVLEHVEEPASFMNKIYDSLRDGGVFWGFTVDRRHPLPWLVQSMNALGLKDRYLRYLQGASQNGDYEHYSTHYLCNSPRQVAPYVQRFRSCDFINFIRVGQIDGYLPSWARPVAHLFDTMQIALKRPGVLLAIRCEK